MKNNEFWFFLFLIGTLFLNWPFLLIFNLSLPFYLFAVWAILIIAIGFFITRENGNKDTDV